MNSDGFESFFQGLKTPKNIEKMKMNDKNERMKRHENCQHGSKSILIIASVLSSSCFLQPELLDTAYFRASQSFVPGVKG